MIVALYGEAAEMLAPPDLPAPEELRAEPAADFCALCGASGGAHTGECPAPARLRRTAC
jgi:hypothetical protein